MENGDAGDLMRIAAKKDRAIAKNNAHKPAPLGRTPTEPRGPLRFNLTALEAETIDYIAVRAAAMDSSFIRITVMVDIALTHCNGCPLNLQAFATTDDRHFVHDVTGIHRHLDRKTGKLGGMFHPRFAMEQ